MGYDEFLQDEYLKERRVDVGSELAKTLFYAFNPKRNADNTLDPFRWPVVDETCIAISYRKHVNQPYIFKIFSSSNDWQAAVRIENPGVILSYFVEQDKITVYSIPTRRPDIVVVDIFNKLQRDHGDQNNHPDNVHYDRNVKTKDWVLEEPREISLDSKNQTQFLSDIRRSICTRGESISASITDREVEAIDDS